MSVTENQTWHEKLYALSYRMFDAEPRNASDRCTYWMTVLGMAIYCGIALLILLTLNLCTLPFGVLAEPTWRPKASFRLLRFSNGLPIIPFSVAVLFGYAAYRTWMLRGALMAVGPWLFVGILGFAFVGLTMVYNRSRGHKDR
jgi:hypothetical protein